MNKVDLKTQSTKDIRAQVDISDIFAEDQYNYKNLHLRSLDKAIDFYKGILALNPNGFVKVLGGSKFKFGRGYKEIKNLKIRLNQEGFYFKNMESLTYDLDVFRAIKKYQEIHGLLETGMIDMKTEASLNIDLKIKIFYLEYSRKNIAKLPVNSTEKYIVINIPAYELYAFKKNTYSKKIEVIIGTLENRTPILNSRLTNVYFNPAWTVPPSLLYTTILQQLIADSEEMKNDGFEVYLYNTVSKTYSQKDITSINWKKYNKSYFPFLVRMKPGKKNPMGKVKFEIVNDQSITIHGTTDHNLFFDGSRASSAGCIRLKDELTLAEFALDGKKGWNLAKIQSLYKSTSDSFLEGIHNQRIAVDEVIPVNIIYQNAWVDKYGFVNFREDIYKKITN